ncbi:MAG: type II secretion system F family protein [Dehalococcoidales bacterium]|jgi:type IV pilus assembly protein PilC
MTYKYVVYTADKKVVEGRVEAISETLAETTLYNAGFQNILSLEEVAPGTSLEKLIPSFFGVKVRDIIDASNQLATLVKSGITITTSLKLLEGQARKPALKKIFHGLVEEIQSGGSLSQAMSRYPRAFSGTYCQVIKASEQAGTLETGLRQAAAYMEKRLQANQKIKRAMAYPVFVLLMALGVSILLVTVALPPLTNLFKSLGANLPWMTRLLVAVTDFLLHQYLYVLGGLVVLILITVWLSRLPSVKLAWDRLILKIPLIGATAIERSVELFCQTGSMLLQAGLRLPQIMDIVIQANRNQIIRQAFGNVKERLIQGEGLSQPMADNKLFPPLLVEMVVVGEKTGTMDNALATMAEYYEREVDRRINTLIALIEPVLTVIIGLVVVFIALSMITPLYSVLKSIH